MPEGIDNKLHLHARRISFPHPSGEGVVDVTAPLPDHMRRSFAAFGFAEADEADAGDQRVMMRRPALLRLET